MSRTAGSLAKGLSPGILGRCSLVASLLASGCTDSAPLVEPPSGSEASVREDRDVLVRLYQATQGDQWEDNGGWLGSGPLDTWRGVETDSTGRVTSIHLVSNNLTGPLPNELARLSRLRSLDLSRNNLAGPVPSGLVTLAHLKTLRIRENELTGPVPSELGDTLEDLTLGFNQLSGPLPAELADHPALKHIDLRHNGLSGPIPPDLGKLAHLETLFLAHNGLSGSLPPEFGRLDKLARLKVNNNNLSGRLPTELSAAPSLEQLAVNANHFSGTIPISYADLTNARMVDWHNNDDLCAPGVAALLEWNERLEVSHGPWCHSPDSIALADVYHQAGGPGWHESQGWLGPAPLDHWHGITEMDSLGRVVALDLRQNGLYGTLSSAIGTMHALRVLRIDNNAMVGGLPVSLANLPNLLELSYQDTILCVPDDPELHAGLRRITVHNGAGVRCDTSDDRFILTTLYATTGGGLWDRQDYWLTDAPLGSWWGVHVDGDGKVVGLELNNNGLNGEIPPILGQFERLRELSVWDNNLDGEIPSELGNLSSLQYLNLEHNALSGALPPELGELTNLTDLRLSGNNLTGTIPSTFNSLSKLRRLRMHGNELTGPIPLHLMELAELEELDLARNRLSGSVMPEMANLTKLKRLALAGNVQLVGALPKELTTLRLAGLQIGNTGLCAPRTAVFQAWLDGIPQQYSPLCPAAEARVDSTQLTAYLMQAVHSRSVPVPLIAGRDALLRVFVTDARSNGGPSSTRTPYSLVIKATFFVGDSLLYAVEVPPAEGLRWVPTEVDEEDLGASANVEIPGWVLRPGLQMVVTASSGDVSENGGNSLRRLLDRELTCWSGNPLQACVPLDVRQVPPLKLTVVPFLLQAEPDSSILEATAGLAEDSDLLWQVRTLAPVEELKVDLHEPVYTSSDDAVTVTLHTEAIRKMEDDEAGSWSSSYWLGMMSVFHVPSGWWGTSIGTGRSSTASAHGRIIAHELLHNMEALHAPCNRPENRSFDYHYPHSEGQIGSIGYDFRRKELVAPSAGWDVMGGYFCNPMWISDYTFSKALSHRLKYEGNARADRSFPQTAGGQHSVARRARALLLWGWIDADGMPSLNPAFVVDAQPSLPVGGGSHQITGRDADGRTLFRLRFDPQEVHHGEGRSVFAFTLPLRSEWAETLPTLARITLVGPGGSTALDETSDHSMALVRDPATGQVRGILRDWPGKAASVPVRGLVEPGVQVQVSQGIPERASWRR